MYMQRSWFRVRQLSGILTTRRSGAADTTRGPKKASAGILVKAKLRNNQSARIVGDNILPTARFNILGIIELALYYHAI